MRIKSLSGRGLGSFDLRTIAWLGVASLAGIAIAEGNLLLALLPLTLMVGLLLFVQLSLAGWCELLLLLTVVSRGVVAVLGLPDAFNFVHYPVAIAFAFAAAQRPAGERGRLPAGRWMTGLLLLTALSSIANWIDPLRALMFVLIIGEPIIVIWAIQRWGVDQATETRVGRFAFVVLLIEIPLGLWQGSTGGWQDAVQGTLVGQGAGSHILGGLLALGLFVWLGGVMEGRHSWLTAALVGIVVFGMLSLAGAVQVILLAAAALPALVLFRSQERPFSAARSDVTSRRTPSRIAVASLLVLFMLTAPTWADLVTKGLGSRVEYLATPSQLDEVVLAKERLQSNPLQFLFGSGPGTTASRAALLLTPRYAKPGSIWLQLPIKPTPLALQYSVESKSVAAGGSAESAASSMLGVIGDLGMFGFVGLALIFVGMYRASKRADSWLAPVVAAALVMTFGLSFIDNWLEYPEFSIPLAILIGLATTPHDDGITDSRRSGQDAREVTSIAHPRGAQFVQDDWGRR